jgi:hypothetical protein
VGGAFLSLAYFDLFYDVVVLVVLLEKLFMLRSPVPATAAQAKVPPLQSAARTP